VRISGRNSGSSEKNIIWADRSMASFLRDMLPLTLLSLLLLAAAVWFQGRTLLAVQTLEMPKAPDRKKLAAYGILFLVCLTCVLRLLSWPVMLAVLMLAVLLIDQSLFRSVDYFLLLTFVCFFLFIGNMERIPAVASLMRELIDGRELPVSVGLSQVISNVPAAILLSGFTEKVRSLLYGVNIGGPGTLIASLASVISYRIYGGSGAFISIVNTIQECPAALSLRQS
jgi:Na+/H+ antiporter NhaD/arsenite permease-like protein